jgi:predicted O-methyltransferase YrrM
MRIMRCENDLIERESDRQADHLRGVAGTWRRVAELAHFARLRMIRTFCALPSISLDEIAPDLPPQVEPILEHICLPPYFGPKEHDDFAPLMRIASYCRPQIIVEFGTAHGNTVANLCRCCPEARVYTVNAPAELQTGNIVTFELSKDEIGQVYRAYGFSHRVTQIFENTLDLDLGRIFCEPVVDLAIVDACHDTEYVVNDFYKVVPYVGANGIVLFHDTHPSMVGHLCGSYQACVRLHRSGFGIRHVRGTWWAIWKRVWNPERIVSSRVRAMQI